MKIIKYKVLCGGGSVEGERYLMLGKLGRLCEQDLQADLARNVERCFKKSSLSHWEE